MSRADGDATADATPAHHVAVRSIHWAGACFDAIAVLDPDESRRRVSSGVGAVIEYRTLEALTVLPYEVQVPWELLDPIHAAYLSAMPESLVVATAQGVTSKLAPPFLRLLLVKVTRDLRSTGSFPHVGRYVPSLVIVERYPRQLEEAVQLAARWRIGLGVLDDGVPSVVAPPPEPDREGLNSKRLTEVVFRQWLAQGAETLENSSHDFSCLDGGWRIPSRSSSSAR